MTFLQQAPFLREQRQYPNDDLKSLANQSDQAYIDIASKVNSRTIGLFATGFQIVTGEAWYLRGSAQKQQTLRQVYTFTATGGIAHGINIVTVDRFTRCWGSYTDGTNWYGVIWGTTVALAGEVTFYVSPTNIVIQSGAGAPAVVRGTVVLEWLSQY